MFRKSPTILVVALCATVLPALSACGQKGDLVLPPGKALAYPAARPGPAPIATPGFDAALPAWPAAPAATASTPNGTGSATPAPLTPSRQP